MCEWKEYKLGELIITNALTINKNIHIQKFSTWIRALSLVIK